MALDAKILIVDDDRSAISEIERMLADEVAGEVESTSEPGQTLYHCGRFQPDLLILDLGLGAPSALEILEDLLGGEQDFPAPEVVGLVEGQSLEERRRARDAGVREFLRRPLDPVELGLRVRSVMAGKAARERSASAAYLPELEAPEGERPELDVLHVLARLVEYRDFKTEQHAERVGDLSARIGRELGMPEQEVAALRDAAPLHDVGMIVVPDRILL
ncbi:MAG TPA: response regulator, partial [Gemmatimonadota bacterium]|nr:response regulator [Gemmatimonadota bacterium]